MIRIDDLAIFVRIASVDSFSAVAREMDLLPSQISTAVKRLERELDIRLFARSTRSLRLTPEGENYLPFAKNVLNSLNAGKACLHQSDTELRGALQIACSSDFGRNILLPWLLEFRGNHPCLMIRLSISDHLSDVYRDPVDVAIRYGLVADADFVSLPLAPNNRRFLAAAPAYLRQYGTPQSIEELKDHLCLRFHLSGKLYDRWAFPLAQGAYHHVNVVGPVISDDADVIRKCALAGEGIIYKSWLDIAQDVQAGRLMLLLPQQMGELFPLNFICPHRKQFTPAIRSLYNYLQDRCRDYLSEVSGHLDSR
jgi:DNA-binding transcriptional LysR family regulator